MIRRVIFFQKNPPFLLILFLFSLLPTISLFRIGTYESGDFNLHIYRIIPFYNSLKEGNIMPSWAETVNASYGNPLYIFNYSLPYYLVSLFHSIGFSFVASMKILLGGTFVLSGIFMYKAANKILESQIASFTAAILYLFNPYHLIDLHFRATPGESTLFMLVPLLIYATLSFMKDANIRYFSAISLVTILLSMAHPMVSTVIHLLTLIFVMLFAKKKNLPLLLLALLTGILGSLYVWLPFILFKPIMYPSTSITHDFIPFIQLFISPYKYGFLFQGPNGELALTMGFVQVFAVFVALLMLILKVVKKLTRQLVLWIVLTLVLIFFMHPYSNIFWDHAKTLWMLSDRLLLPVALCTSLIGGYVVLNLSSKKFSRALVLLFLLLAILSTIFNWGHRKVISNTNDTSLTKEVASSTFKLEGKAVYFLNTKWADKNNFWFEKNPTNHIQITHGSGTISQIFRNSTQHTYVMYSKAKTEVVENTLWYPGWSLKVNNNVVPISPGDRGTIATTIPAGFSYLDFSYTDIFPYKVAKLSGFLIFLTLIIVFLGSFSSHPKYFSREVEIPNLLNRKYKSKK